MRKLKLEGRVLSLVGRAMIPLVAVCLIGPLLIGWSLAQTPAEDAVTWVEETFEDFNDGQFDASGVNLYATRKGTVTTVNRFDLNGDGFIDLVFNSSHDEVRVPPAISYEVRPIAAVAPAAMPQIKLSMHKHQATLPSV